MKRIDAFFQVSAKRQERIERPLKEHHGLVAVAKYYPGTPPPHKENFETILIHTTDKNLGGDLSPYVLKDEQGCLLENIWQFAKVYPHVTQQRVPLSKFQQDTIIWEHPAEVHCENDEITPAYWKWRKKGMKNPWAVRYPNGFHGRRSALFSVWKNDANPSQIDRMDYIEARKRIYCGEYIRLGPRTPHFKTLQQMLNNGKNLLIVEVDGPDPTLDYPPYDKISSSDPALMIDEEVIRLLINDRRKPFGHGFVIASLLLNGFNWLR